MVAMTAGTELVVITAGFVPGKDGVTGTSWVNSMEAIPKTAIQKYLIGSSSMQLMYTIHPMN